MYTCGLNIKSPSLVPPQTPESINAKVTKFLNEQFDTLGTRNHLDVQMVSSGLPWVENTKHWNYDAAISAIKVCLKRYHSFAP